MKNILLATILGSFLALGVQAADKEEKTIEGTMSCAKCELGEAEECADVVKTEDGTAYYLKEDGKAKTSAHKCQGEVEVTVTGTVKEKKGKNMLKVAKIETKS